ncbi:MAG TPA: hypothetical protein PKN47_21755 [Nitrospira sp.]|jgi:hypothetical protein|nr:hypothetical protein [Nitrospira sp.]
MVAEESFGEIRKLTLESAIEKFLDEFLKMHPKQQLPEWFKFYTTSEVTKDLEGNWVVSFTVLPKEALSSDEFMEDGSNRSKCVYKSDPISKEKVHILSNTTESEIVIFKAVVNVHTGAVKVITDVDFSKLDKNNLLQIKY